MDYDLKQLIEEQALFLDTDVSDKDWEKLQGEPVAGGKVEIKWKGREFTDKGYFFALPMSDVEIYDVCVHIPFPDNYDGMDDAPPVWINLYQIVSNNLVKEVICK